MRAGISRVVVEIIILVIAVALALLIFSPISGYIFGSLGRTSTVGGASQIQILNVNFTKTGSSYNTVNVDVKNLGPGTIPPGEWRIYVDGVSWGSNTTNKTLQKDETITITAASSGATADITKQHSIVVYGPGNTQAQYLYYPKG